ncbi:hypothetical protein Vadar_022226 [Vaccinium darrowii]|uniref:Uncharacterized protein n=1 Tax=Vaccinium darrowii TaxID=229202 RepID=A0ACB7YNX1_9ERIC|nr:hypothetical protein Vadar_022226 [Vaccinium darrowii]
MDGLITVYVDNLHRDMDVIWLQQIFSPCERVVDVFIPSKKSKSFNTKFGFIRFKRREEALRAINDLNGLLIRGFRMFVQFAKFSKSSSPSPKFFQKMRDENHIVTSNGVSDGNTKAVDGVAAGSGWLQNSAVGKLIKYCYVHTFQDLFISNGIWDAHIRPLGGLNVLVSFDSIELLDTFLKDKDNVLPKMVLFCGSLERSELQTFKLWGDVIRLDELTEKLIAFDKGHLFILTDFLDCINEVVHVKIDDTIYPVKVVEDPLAETSWGKCVFTSIKIKQRDNLIGKDAVFEMVEVEHEDDGSCDLNVHGPLVEKVCLSNLTNDMEFEPCNHSTDVGNHFSFSRDVDSFVGESKFSPGNEAVAVGTQSERYSIEDGVATTRDLLLIYVVRALLAHEKSREIATHTRISCTKMKLYAVSILVVATCDVAAYIPLSVILLLLLLLISICFYCVVFLFL